MRHKIGISSIYITFPFAAFESGGNNYRHLVGPVPFGGILACEVV